MIGYMIGKLFYNQSLVQSVLSDAFQPITDHPFTKSPRPPGCGV
jgi:hypothetical protein